MATFYERMAATAARLIKKYGRPLELERRTAAGEDPVDGERFGVVPRLLSTRGIDIQFGQSYLPESEILAGDKLVVIDATQLPLKSDLLVDGGAKWTIVQIDSKKPATLSLVHFLRVRR